MQFFYSPEAAGFFCPDIHASIPEDAVEISADEHAALLAGQSQGKRIVADGGGRPTLVDPPPPSDEQLAAAARVERDTALTATDWLVARHRDETDAGGDTTLTANQFKALLAYRQVLRDLPDQKGFPAVAMPEAPDFL
ncbi:phage tail assembly chaperone [Geminicoccus harenae]|uniref:phage tail assembly chaperone n=1 Tax=Geminicoccus harenae TaxID=2498453 RepID=UPI00168AEDCD|nr:phage tail assembly chaperone [Geminicoccus harenae]